MTWRCVLSCRWKFDQVSVGGVDRVWNDRRNVLGLYNLSGFQIPWNSFMGLVGFFCVFGVGGLRISRDLVVV